MDVGRTAQGEIDEPHADRVVGEAVDEDEAAKVAVLVIGRKGDGCVKIEIADADLVELERLRRHVLERVDVDLVFRTVRARRCTVRAPILMRYGRPGSIGSSPIHRMLGLELIGDLERVRRPAHEDVAAADIDLVVERDGDRLAGQRLFEIAIKGDDAGDRQVRPEGRTLTSSPGLHGAGGDRSRQSRGTTGRGGSPIAPACETACRCRRRRSARSRDGRRVGP